MGSKRKRSSRPHEGYKRQNTAHDNEDDELSGFQAARGYFDATTGQRGAFPGLEEYGDEFFCGPANDGMDYLRMVRSEARGVPSLLIAKAPTMPMPSLPEYDAGDDEMGVGQVYTSICKGQDAFEAEEYGEDTRGWYEDGTYIANGTASYPQRPPSPQKVAVLTWHDSFMSRFRQMRKLLHESSSSPPSISPDATEGNMISNTRPIPHRQEDWVDLIYKTSPTPTFLWKMDQYTVLKAMKIMVDLLKVGTDTPVEQTRWIYSLLLRCSEVMTPDEVYIVRELGKKALQVQKKLEMSGCLANKRITQVAETAPEQRGSHSENLGEGEVEDGEIAEGKRESEGQDENDLDTSGVVVGIDPSTAADNLKSSKEGEAVLELLAVEDLKQLELSAPLEASSPDPNALANQRLHKKRKNRKPKNGAYNYIPSPNTLCTLDMIISIVGDVFGQRDLLDERRYHSLGDTWNEG